MYYQKENRFIFIDGSISVVFTSEDKEGFYQAYLAWVAEGNTATEWTGM
jgi:hypothetical protein